MKKRLKEKSISRDDVLIEVGFEELPLEAQELLYEHAVQALPGRLKALFLEPSEVVVYSTPRRLVWHLKGLPRTQTQVSRDTEVGPFGPLYNADGSPTPQAKGFAHKKQVPVDTLTLVEVNGKQRIVSEKINPPEKAEAILGTLIASILKEVNFPKVMRYSGATCAFPRPIRWVLGVRGKGPFTIQVEHLRSGTHTYMPRWKKQTAVTIKSIEGYFAFAAKNRIALDKKQRTQAIFDALAAHTDFVHKPLVEEVSGLVETPSFIKGVFSPKYLDLPREILIASMSKGQRIFPVVKKGVIKPEFIAVLNGNFAASDKEKIKETYHRILDAKLKDSLFFFEKDKKLSLEARVLSLKNVAYLKGLGSYYDKMTRLKNLAARVATLYALDSQETKALQRAVFLCKADLLTSLVYEFPSLEGVMGGVYAGLGKEDPLVIDAIAEHYKPRMPEDTLPATKVGKVLSIIDKLDTIGGCFLTGVKPKGSYDPYGLKRQAAAVVRVLGEMPDEVSLETLVKETLALYEAQAHTREAEKEIQNFLFERLVNTLLEKSYTQEYIDAVAATRKFFIYDFLTRLHALAALRKEDFFTRAAKVAERTGKIVRAAKKEEIAPGVDPALFREPIEHTLWQKYAQHKDAIASQLKEKSYKEALALYGNAFFEAINEFFAHVLVNAPDAAVRRNRLALMNSFHKLLSEEFADLSYLESINSIKKQG